ncbi:MAG: D amino acid oxidase (DAO) family protein [unclassified Hahellaceae]|nr:D amino acid oxidase (DAO) family protein [Hahellaceae bacterium]|tara:strand:+ start:10382 stop:11533 length:1152 start_codon:yes stop_codon:yes gene_type:complete
MINDGSYDAVVIGAGFYGTAVAVYLAKQRGLKRILLVEQASAILTRASYNNQARVHNGYHYPRSYTTAFRSRVNLPKFVQDWPLAVRQDFTKLYAIARRNSKVTSKQFVRFCKEIGADIRPAERSLVSLFEPRLIESVFEVVEYAFNSERLADWARTELAECDIETRLNTRVMEITKGSSSILQVALRHEDGQHQTICTRYVFNCTYSGLNQFGTSFAAPRTGLKHEITEMALMKVPAVLENVGITVMDGPFFSIMPFPARDLHTLSHVRYTPHTSWLDEPTIDPYERLASYARDTRVDRMMRDVSRYLPAMSSATYEDSLFEVKTVLLKNEGDDGRPILFERHQDLLGCYSILGGKIDNIYDVLEKLDQERLETTSQLIGRT